MYKIFVNDFPLCITAVADAAQFPGYATLIYESPDTLNRALEIAQHPSREPGLLLLADDPDACYRAFESKHKAIHAAGGIVFNKNGELLIIRRLGHWDLPKGKLDEGETLEAAAVREVEEECGINNLVLQPLLGMTYHMYQLKGEMVLKISHWYQMQYPGDDAPKPQTEEHITEARWVNWSLEALQEMDFYSSIKDLLLRVKIR